MTDDPRQYLRLHRESATGLSFLYGDAVTGVDDLPMYRVEIHCFDDANTSAGFVAGLDCASKNALAWTWEPGRKLGNRCVIVAHLDGERPGGATIEDVIGLVVHQRNRHESSDLAASMKEIWADREQREMEDRESMAPLRAALTAAGIADAQGTMRWVRFGDGILVNLVENSRYEVECSVHLHRSDGDQPLIERYAEHFAALGFTLDPAEPYELAKLCADTPEAAVALAKRMEAAVKGLPPIAKAFWHERFMAEMRVTPNRRRFLLAGAETGIFRSWERRNLKFSAGGITIKQTEINTLIRAGWIADAGGKATVTPEGLVAAQAPVETKRGRRATV